VLHGKCYAAKVQRIPSLDGLRAISISLVCVAHLTHVKMVPSFFSYYAVPGVQIFFVISGYLITTILLSEHQQTSTIDLRQFYIRRAYRILPAAGVYMLFAFSVYWHQLRWYDVVAVLLYLVNFDMTRPWMVGHLWSLGVEEQFYFLWPTLLKRWYRHRIAILLGAIIFAPIFSTVCFYFKIRGGGFGMFPSVANTLAIGCLLAILSPYIPRITGWAAFIMLLAVIFVPTFDAYTRIRTLFSLFVLSPIMQCSMAGLVLHTIRSPYRFLNFAPVIWLGRISYSLYLWQQPFFYAQIRYPAYRLLYGLALACLSYYVVEQPILRLRQIRAARRSSKENVLHYADLREVS
jgi:peptidoglycan/LPS O-acetylase OafA/YrhL